jgi:hydrogenase/urease accessory protein HupE
LRRNQAPRQDRRVTRGFQWRPWRTCASALFLIVLLSAPIPLASHPAPFSYLDVYVTPAGLSGRLVVHDLDAAHELQLPSPAPLADQAFLEAHFSALADILSRRLRFFGDGREIPWTFRDARIVERQDAIELRLQSTGTTGARGKLTIAADLFPYDSMHQTFVNIYENEALTRQEVLSRTRTSVDFFSGSRQGLFAVFATFTRSGIHHIAIGPDHILFIIGLLLLGGSLPRLLAIVTAFTIGHSITLALATLQIVSPPARIIEPAIALSIVYVGADNLLTGTKGRDVRAWIALMFGLIHGFGFASVLRETGLPNRALGISLFSFNLGVEIGQAVIVVLVATTLSLIRNRDAVLARRIVTTGSVVVMAAGAFWFFQRVLG